MALADDRRRHHRAARIASRIRKAGIIARPFAMPAPTPMDARSTAIYFLLARGERSHWHRVDAVEIWHYYAGSALTLRIADDGGAAAFQARPRSRRRRTAAGDRAGACLAIRRKQRRLDAGRLHRRAGIRVCDIRDGAEGLEPHPNFVIPGCASWRSPGMTIGNRVGFAAPCIIVSILKTTEEQNMHGTVERLESRSSQQFSISERRWF